MAGFAGIGGDDFQFGTIRKGCFVGQATKKAANLCGVYTPQKNSPLCSGLCTKAGSRC